MLQSLRVTSSCNRLWGRKYLGALFVDST